MSEPRSAQPEHQGPDFVIVGPLRAGTTMFRLMLGNHPQIADVGEFEESVAMLGGSGYPSQKQYRDWLTTHRVAQSRAYDLPESLQNYQSIARSMWSQLARDHEGSKAIGCTIHSRIDRILDLWPDTKLICLVRDPRDVCRSCVGMGWYGHAAMAYPKWLDPIRHWESARDRLPEDRWTLIRYEDLLRDPESELRKCTDLLGVEYDPAMLGFHESSSYEKLDPSLAEQWKRKMSPRCAELIDAQCVGLMRDYGYETSVESPRGPSGLEKLGLRLSDAIGRLRWRIDRYGLPLELSWKIAKRLPITNRWRMSVRNRINEIDHQHLR